MKDFNLCQRPYACINVTSVKNPSQTYTGCRDQNNNPCQPLNLSVPNVINFGAQNTNSFGGVNSSSGVSGYNGGSYNNTYAPNNQHQIPIEKTFTPTYTHYQGSYNSGYTTSKMSFQDIIKKTSCPPHGKLLIDQKMIDISKSGLKDGDIALLVGNLKYQELNLYKFDASNNSLGNNAVENLFYTFRLGSPTATYNIKFINLSNNKIGDDGAKYIASHLGAGLHPNLNSLDISGNQITPKGHGYFIEALDNIKEQTIKIVVTSINNVKCQAISALKWGAKEIRTISKANGIEIKEALTTQETIEYCKKGSPYFIKNVVMGFVKCKTPVGTIIDISEGDFKYLAIDVAIKKIGSKKIANIFSFICIGDEIISNSIEDENFTGCLIGLDKIIEDNQ